MKNNFYRTLCHEPKQYTRINQEIFTIPNLPLATLGLLVRLLSVGNNWVISTKGLAKICFCGVTTIRTQIKELEKFGFMKVVRTNNETTGYFETTYYLRDSLDIDFMNREVTISDESEHDKDTEKNLPVYSPYPDNPHAVNAEPYTLCKNKLFNNTEYKDINNNLINNNINNNNINNNISYPSNKSFKNLSYSTQNINSVKNNSLVEDKFLHGGRKKDSEDFLTEKGARVKKGNKNKVQRMEEEKGDSIRTVDTQLYNKLGNLLEEDNETSRNLKMLLEMVKKGEDLTKTNMTKTRNLKQCKKRLAELVTDTELCDKFADFIEVKIQTSGMMPLKSLELIVEDAFQKFGNDRDLMIAVLREATKRRWQDLYVTDELKQQVKLSKATSINNQVKQEDEEYDYALDENGNRIGFK